MEKKSPFEMTSVKPIDTELLPYGSWVLADLNVKDEELAETISLTIEKLLKQMRAAQKEYGITPDTGSLQFVIKVNPDWPVTPPNRAFEPRGTIAIKYYARRVPNDEVLSEKKNTGTGGRDSERKTIAETGGKKG